MRQLEIIPKYVGIKEINEGQTICLYDEQDAQYVLDNPSEYKDDVKARAKLLIATEPERRERENTINNRW